MLTGYMDDSANDRGTLVTLGCVIADGTHWERFEKEWKLLLEQTNAALLAAGKPTISRYHASDCSTLNGEFESWDIPMTREITAEIKNIFNRCPLVTVAFGAEVSDIVAVFPEASEKAHNLAFAIFLTHITGYIADRILPDVRWPEESMTFIHDRGSYNGVLHDTFEYERLNSKYQNKLTSLTPMGWETAILLQPADFIAYESFKAIERELEGNKRRKSLQLLLDLKFLGAFCQKLQKADLQQFRDSLNNEDLTALFKNARINASV